MSNYVDGFVIPLPKDKINDYKRMAEQASQIWKEHGALDYWECIGDDLEVKDMISFMKIANAGPDDTVVFAWIVFESREHRDAVNARVMADPRLKEMCDPANQLFDYKKMAYGGFKTLVHA
ncbi:MULTISPECIES: DUF1428 domain-containing protein [unclassified Nitrosomonas]|uniref:DUF1428 domain-containing protein n=1 Tax=unclassified Nitrosomonas TaxID=2609265 RepID=UPI0008992484|nr:MULTISPECIES: DUF1428 domain-containing protein [unclassified Nitrosomonas]MDV6344865.1 DUF1428 domain-containing protein [Nitrosomonas sp. Is37]SDY02293.1 Uncharacterized conserved protein YbaA, DUF1428 family [Nitrosomonas sp. Nm33]